MEEHQSIIRTYIPAQNQQYQLRRYNPHQLNLEKMMEIFFVAHNKINTDVATSIRDLNTNLNIWQLVLSDSQTCSLEGPK
jgi:hypothetical protein